MNSKKQEQGDRLQFLGHLAGGLAHEIKNPLSTMNINLQMLQEDWSKPENKKENRLVKKIDLLLGEVKRLENILDDFLKFAQGSKRNLQITKIHPILPSAGYNCDLILIRFKNLCCAVCMFFLVINDEYAK